MSNFHGSAGNRRTVPAGSSVLAGGAVLLALLTGCASGGSGTAATAPQTLPGSAAPVAGNQAPDSSSAAADTPTGAPETDAPGSSAPATSGGPTASQSSADTSTPDKGSATSSRCHTSDLKAAVGRNDPGAGQENFPLVLTNKSNRTCTIFGFPGMAFINAAGQQVAPNPERSSAPKMVVSLAPGKSAWAPMSFGNPEVTGVTTVTPAAILITPPDEKASLKVAWTGGPVSNTGKASVPQLSPFMAGTGA